MSNQTKNYFYWNLLIAYACVMIGIKDMPMSDVMSKIKFGHKIKQLSQLICHFKACSFRILNIDNQKKNIFTDLSGLMGASNQSLEL